MAKQENKLVHCRYAKCQLLHETTELNKNDAIQGGRGAYYHPDCYHTMKTIFQIRDTFVQHINPLMTSKQIGVLVATINKMVFDKHIDVDFIEFSLNYFIKHKPGKLHQPFGLYYIVQDKDVVQAWHREQDIRLRAEIRKQQEEMVDDDVVHFTIEIPSATEYKPQNKSKFSSVLGV